MVGGAPGRPSSSLNVRPNAAFGAEELKEIRRHERRTQLLGIPVAGERHRAARPDATELRERRGPLADVAEVGTGNRTARRPPSQMNASRSASRYGSGSISIAWAMLEMVVLAPMPRARVSRMPR